MWGLNRFQRPAWSTGILIPLGFLSGIGAALFIFLGTKKTKRTEEVEKRLKAALASDSSFKEHASNAPSNVTGLKTIAEISPNDEGQLEAEKSNEETVYPAKEAFAVS